MQEKINNLKKKFIEVFGGDDKNLRVFASPGRVNLIGEHTDYNGGFVFPAALTLGTVIIARRRNDNTIGMYATDLDLKVSGTLDDIEKSRDLKWGNYQMGVANELIAAGYNVVGCDMLFDMDLPPKSGLSSSASIEVATAVTLATLGLEAKGVFGKELDMVEMSIICQKTEHNFCGVNCGIMDQFASAMGKKDHAIFLDCKSLKYRHVPINMPGYKLVISNTNCKRSLAHSKYNERRSECEAGFEILKKVLPDATCLGDITMEQYNQNKHLITNEIVRKRVEFVISEDDRVLKSIDALEKNDLVGFGKLLSEAHTSIKNLYEVTGVELDTLVDEAMKVEGVLGSRMTGAGFGGCTVSIVKADRVDTFISQVGKNYTDKVGIKAEFYVCEIGDGGREIK